MATQRRAIEDIQGVEMASVWSFLAAIGIARREIGKIKPTPGVMGGSPVIAGTRITTDLV